MIKHMCDQGGQLWHDLRRGRITASEMHRILTPRKRVTGRGAQSYIEELIGDSLSIYYRPRAESYMSRATQWGQQVEEEARRMFTLSTGLEVEKVGFCTTDDGRAGCSPDGLIEPDSGLEIKCPEAKTHTKYLLANKVPSRYLAQVHGGMIVTGRPSWWFVSYAPLTSGPSALILKVERDEYTEALEKALWEFYERYQEALELVKQL